MDRTISLRWSRWAALASVALVVVVCARWLIGGFAPDRLADLRTAVAVLAAAAFCMASGAWHGPDARPIRALQAVCLAVAGTIWARELYLAITGAPREWDFLCFLLDAKVAGAGLNLYDPASYRSVAEALSLQLSDGFRREILDVGFKYPPPTALLFVPLAAFDVATANAIWHAVVAASIVGSGAIAAWLLPQPRRADALLLGVTLACCLDSAVYVQPFGQTLALLTCLIGLTVLAQGSRWAGVWNALAVLVKPFMVAPIALLATTRRWAAVLAALAMGAAFVVASLAVLGADDWAGFLSGRTAGNIPPAQYSQTVNQSLLGVLMRANGATGTPTSHPGVLAAYATVATLLLAGTLLAATIFAKRAFGPAYMLVVVAAMMAYPGTLHYYAAALLIPLVLAFRGGTGLHRASGWWPTLFVAVVFMLLSRYGAFSAMVFVWSALFIGCLAGRTRSAERAAAFETQGAG